MDGIGAEQLEKEIERIIAQAQTKPKRSDFL